MKPELLLKADLLDIIFEHRNKEYGAYTLRRDYNSRLVKALCTVLVLLVLCFVLYYALNRNTSQFVPVQREIKDLELKQVDMEQPELPKPPVEPLKQVATIRDVVPLIVPDNVQADPPPTIDELMEDKAAIGIINSEGEPPGNTSPPTEQSAGTAEMVKAPEPEVEKPVFEAEVMPEFPGGIEGLRRFLGRHLRVPEEVMQPGQRVKVPVRLIVAKDGTLENVDFLAEADDLFKKEIRRVVNKMPKWKPGSQKGKTVAVYITIPIIFEIPE